MDAVDGVVDLWSISSVGIVADGVWRSLTPHRVRVRGCKSGVLGYAGARRGGMSCWVRNHAPALRKEALDGSCLVPPQGAEACYLGKCAFQGRLPLSREGACPNLTVPSLAIPSRIGYHSHAELKPVPTGHTTQRHRIATLTRLTVSHCHAVHTRADAFKHKNNVCTCMDTGTEIDASLNEQQHTREAVPEPDPPRPVFLLTRPPWPRRAAVVIPPFYSRQANPMDQAPRAIIRPVHRSSGRQRRVDRRSPGPPSCRPS